MPDREYWGIFADDDGELMSFGDNEREAWVQFVPADRGEPLMQHDIDHWKRSGYTAGKFRIVREG